MASPRRGHSAVQGKFTQIEWGNILGIWGQPILWIQSELVLGTWANISEDLSSKQMSLFADLHVNYLNCNCKLVYSGC